MLLLKGAGDILIYRPITCEEIILHNDTVRPPSVLANNVSYLLFPLLSAEYIIGACIVV